jgi:DNA/RNA-binding domain of Phe-tRNA-synthetase-like protein
MTHTALGLEVAAELARIVVPVAAAVGSLRVRVDDAVLDAVLREAAADMRRHPEPAQVTVAVRTMYKAVGLDPTKTRPSSEALLRRIRKGDGLPRVNNVVDVINWCSLESQLPFGLYDEAQVQGVITMRRGRDGEFYPGIRKNLVHLAGRLVVADAQGPFGNPTSDSARTMVTTETRRVIVVIFAPAAVDSVFVGETLAVTLARLERFCGAA